VFDESPSDGICDADPPYFIITSPTSSSYWGRGGATVLEWESPGSGDAFVNIWLTYPSDSCDDVSIVNDTDNDGNFGWLVPFDLIDATQRRYSIKVEASGNPAVEYGFSPTFHIYPQRTIDISSPSSSSSWGNGTTHTIEWDCDNFFFWADIALYKDDVFNQTIATHVSNTGSYEWDIPSDLKDSTKYQINVTAEGYPTEYDFSSYFEIAKDPKEESKEDNNDDENGGIDPVLIIIPVAAGIAGIIAAVPIRKKIINNKRSKNL